MFITFEGTEGSGKTTQIKATFGALQAAGYDVLLTREPGGTTIGTQIRGILLDTAHQDSMNARAELLLFCASRAQLVSEIIEPHLAKGGIVICDRYADSTLAYQGYGHGLDLAALRHILDFATAGRYPDLTVYLDLVPERGLLRKQQASTMGEEWNRLDAMELAFHQRVYAGYQALIAQEPARFLRVNADASPQAVQEDLLARLLPRLQG